MSNILISKCKELRKKYLDIFLSVNQGHPGSVFSQVEILSTLFYGNIIDYNDKKNKNRDKLIISKGHSAMGLYPILADYGFFSESELKNIGKPNGLLRIFANISIPGIDATTGSLGHGIGVGSGYALADKNDNKLHRTFVLISEGEMYEGSIWESALFASHYSLDNLVVILDRNHKIILGDTEDLLKLEPIEEKWKSFGFEVSSVDGHNLKSLKKGFEIINNNNSKPKIIIADTIKGKGISFMENVPSWHYWQDMSEEQIKTAYGDIEKLEI